MYSRVRPQGLVISERMYHELRSKPTCGGWEVRTKRVKVNLHNFHCPTRSVDHTEDGALGRHPHVPSLSTDLATNCMPIVLVGALIPSALTRTFSMLLVERCSLVEFAGALSKVRVFVTTGWARQCETRDRLLVQ